MKMKNNISIEDKKICIDINRASSYLEGFDYIVILLPTGIKWEMQVGGMLCLHKQPEGIAVLNSQIDFDDCDGYCSGLFGNTAKAKKKRESLAIKIDHMFKEGWDNVFKFDFSRIDDLLEAYWPICYNLKGQWLKAIYHHENCD
jgi:hypothetical protein